jgi:hypothetical protein
MIYAPLPGEYIASAVRRGLDIQGIKTLKKSDYIIKRSRQLKFIFPSIFADHNITKDLLQENTLFPLAQALGRTSIHTPYTPILNWKICIECVTHDIKTYGTAYIHCRHLPGTVTHCKIHATELYKNCPSCLKLVTRHRLVDFERCQESFPTKKPIFSSPQHDLAVFVSDLLTYDGKSPESKNVERAIFQKLVTEKYQGDFVYAYSNIMADASKQLGIDIVTTKLVGLSLNISSMLAFFAFQRSEVYIESVIKLRTHR